MAPADALRAATTTAATVLGAAKSLGQITPGFAADLVVVAGDPLLDPEVLREPLLVIARGRVVLDRR